MIELIKELLKREWEFQMVYNEDAGVYHLQMCLGNGFVCAYGNDDAKELLKEIRMHW